MKYLKLSFPAAAFIAVFLFCCGTSSEAVTIPLDGAVVNGSGQNNTTKNSSSGGGIAYVDIELIFNEHPMTARLKGDFETEVEKRKKEFSTIESSMSMIQDVIVSSSAEITKLKAEIVQVKKAIDEKNQAPKTMILPGTTNVVAISPAVSSSTVKADPAVIAIDEEIIKERESSIAVLKDKYAGKKRELEERTKSNKDELVKLETTNSQAVIEDIYKVLGKIAIEEGLTIVVDKNNVLYGQASLDLTQKVRDRMRGR